MNKKKICMKRLMISVVLIGTILIATDSFAGQMGGFDVQVGDGYYTWNEEQWGSDYYQQWNNTGDNTQQNWNSVEDNTHQNWDSSEENIQQNWGGAENPQHNWSGAENPQQNWSGAENPQQNWGGAEENTQHSWGSAEVNPQQNWSDTWNNPQQNWNSSTGNNPGNQYNWNDPSGNMNSNGSQLYQENSNQGYWSPTQTPNPTVTPVPVLTVTSVPMPKPTITPKLSQTPTPTLLIPKTLDFNTVKSHFYQNFLFEESDLQKTQHLPDEAVFFGHEKKVWEGNCPSITLNSNGSVQILSFRINEIETPWHWENNMVMADTPVKKGENQIELFVLSQGGKMVYMDPWKFSA